MRGHGDRFEIIFLTLIAVMILGIFGYADKSYADASGYTVYTSYRDVPGVTEQEIEAIESLRKNRERFIYGAYTSTESFYRPDGSAGGYTALLCGWLSGLFGIPFEPVIYDWDKWNDLMDDLTSGDVDFNGDLTRTPERLENNYMTEFIAERVIKMLRVADSETLSEIAKYRPLRYVFYEGTSTYAQVSPFLEDNCEVLFAGDYPEIYAMLKNGEADAYFDENAYEASFDGYGGDVIAEDFLPLVYGTVSLTTRNPELAPVISVVQKALENGAIQYLANLYTQGHREYLRHKLFLQLTDEERAYVNAHVKSGGEIPVVLEFDNYPISFYNESEKEWQGIALDILAEIETLTGLRFERVNDENASWADLASMLESGEAALVSELIVTPEREGEFLWPNIPYMTDNCALLTRLDFKDVNINEIFLLKIGLVQGTAYADTFRRWFPHHPDVTEYQDNLQALESLERGEVDAVMSSQKMLLHATNYLEKPGYKLNILFNQGSESFFGLNKNETALCSIISKALRLVNTNTISARWLHRMFDYRSSILKAQRPFLIAISLLLIGIVLLLWIMYFRSSKTNRYLSAAVAERTRELEDQTKAALSASRAKSDFLAKMSHEIRTPMNTITGMSELILRNEISPEVFEYAEDIKQAGANLLVIINDILDFSKIESGKMEIFSGEYAFASLMNDVITAVRVRMTEKPVDFVTNIDSSLPCKMIGDEIRIRQILLNLLSNAVKYTNEGKITFSASGRARGSGKIELIFEVSDTGIGIKKDDMDKLFGDFVQFDPLKNKGVEGTGLGLAIALSLCRAMGGDITVSSEYGKGSTFTARIPQKIEDARPFAMMKDQDAKNTDSAGRPINSSGANARFTAPSARVLLVDDIATNLRVAVELLSPYKLQTDKCTSGAEAVSLAQEKHYDIIFMDHMMPGMDGVTAMETIRAFPGDYFKEVPIIALTANAISGMREMFLEKGFSDYLSKPIEIRKLNEILERWIPKEKRAAFSDVGFSHGEPRQNSALLPLARGLKEALDVSGVNFEKAMNQFGGSTEAFLGVLRSYVKHTPAILEILRSPAPETLHEYAIAVHGLKGSSYGVCADSVGKLAEELETAAKEGRLELVLAKNGALFAAAEKLLSGISPVLKSIDREKGKNGVRQAPDRSTLETIMEASSKCDITALEKTVSALELFSYENRADLVTWLRDQTDNLEYEAIRERLEKELTNWNYT
jgi:signal transduction histidine kinase/CheY-like chemotaxis protein/HPt (histidine-containing phosphotransfer) domain-containing protein